VPIRSGRETFEFERTDATEVAEQAVGHALTPGAVSSYWWKQSIDWIGAHPVDWIVLLGKKVLVTWNRAELPDSESLEIYADYSPVLRALALVFGFGLLVAAAAPGMVLAWRSSPRPVLLYLMLFGFSAAVAAFYVFARYRFPMVPILALFAGHTIAAASDALRARPRPKPDAAVAGAAALGLLVACLPPVVPPIGSRRLGYVNLAVGFASNGNQEAAAAAYRKAIALAPRIAEPHHDLAVVLNALGRSDEAAAELETAVRLDPQYAAAHEDLGALLAKRGDLEGAARHFRKAAELAPSQSKYHYRLAAVLADLNRTDEAAAELESTLRLDQQSAAAHDDLGVILARRGDLAGAERQFREAFRIDPARASTLANLGGVALEQGRAAEAADWYRKALAIDPGSSAIRANLAEALQRAGRR
jgi:Flp pilus assembly protein TadD